LRFISNDEGRLFGDSTDCRRRYTLKQDEHLHRVYVPTPISPRIPHQRRGVGRPKRISDATNLTVGLPLGRHDSNYHDVDGSEFGRTTIWGGRVALCPHPHEHDGVRQHVARHKSGGFNTDGTLDADLRQFDRDVVQRRDR
jgi:hypothetical protein